MHGMRQDAKPKPQIGDSVFVRGGYFHSTVRTLLGVVPGGYKVSDTRSGSIVVPGVEYLRPGPESIKTKIAEMGGLPAEQLHLLERLIRKGYWAEIGEDCITVMDPIRANGMSVEFRATKLPADVRAVTQFLMHRS
jgi:hypothetical protein